MHASGKIDAEFRQGGVDREGGIVAGLVVGRALGPFHGFVAERGGRGGDIARKLDLESIGRGLEGGLQVYACAEQEQSSTAIAMWPRHWNAARIPPVRDARISEHWAAR